MDQAPPRSVDGAAVRPVPGATGAPAGTRRPAPPTEVVDPVALPGPPPLGPGWRWKATLGGRPVIVSLLDTTLDRAGRRRFGAETPARHQAHGALAPTVASGVDGANRPWLARATADDEAGLGPLPIADAVSVGHQAATALAALHRSGVVHGAVQPAALARSGTKVVLSDPAVGVLLERLGPPVPEMAAPEVLAGSPPGPAADVFSLAATVTTLLTGSPPHARRSGAGATTAADAAAVLLSMTAGPSPDLVRSGVAPPVAAVLSRSLAVEPGERLTAAQLADALAALVAGVEQGDDDGDRLDTLPPSVPPRDRAAPAGTPLGSRYLLVERLGRGASGEVWRGVQRDGSIAVAVKVLRAELADDHALVTRFLQERTTLTAIRHPHLVGVRDLVAEGSTLAIVMDLVEGPDLRRYLRRTGPVAPSAACALLAQLADGLAAVHAAGVIHRDLKPENVLLEAAEAPPDAGAGGPRVRLSDFGVARSAGGPAITRTDQLIGTPEYLAPELIDRRPQTPAADIYSLGVIAYEMLSGRRPFEAEHPAVLLRAHLEEVPSTPPGLDATLWQLVAACLAKEPAERPSAAELCVAFVDAASTLSGVPALAPMAPGDGPAADGPAAAAPLVGPAPVGHDHGHGHGHDDETGTAMGATLAPRPRTEVPSTSRRRLVVVGVMAAVVAGLAMGVVVSTSTAPPSDMPLSTEAAPAPKVVTRPLSTSAAAAGPGAARLTFPDVSDEDGFQRYLVFRDDNVPLPERVAGGASFVDVAGLEPGSQHCFVVVALFLVDAEAGPEAAQAGPEGGLLPTAACTTVGS